MMNIFEQLKDIIQYKKNKISDDIEFEKDFTPYMVQRWLSFHSPQYASILNCTSNTLWQAVDEKALWYKFFIGIIPQSRFRSIKYVKKNKENTQAKLNTDIVNYLAEKFELPKSEITNYLESGLVDIKSLKRQLQD
jgi:hypothetical protein